MNSARRILAALVVVLALCVAPAAHAKVDYSMNAAGGDYASAVTPQEDTAAPSDSDFAWGAAALGAGAALAVVLLVAATRMRLNTSRPPREAA